MIIIFGATTKDSDVGEGTFHCPVCRQERPYIEKQVRRYFSLFFIPVLPLDKQGRYVVCQGCGARHDARILR